MMKKIFAIIFLGTAILISGCGGENSSEVHEHSHAVAQASPVAKNIPNFTAKTINGADVTNEIFASKKITIVNIWGTFCPPCIAEMPELGKLARSLPADAQLIGIVCDASEKSAQIQRAVQITKEARADFVNIIPDAALTKFMENVEAVPTTIFVNNKGEVVGNAIVGANVEAYKNELEKLLKD